MKHRFAFSTPKTGNRVSEDRDLGVENAKPDIHQNKRLTH